MTMQKKSMQELWQDTYLEAGSEGYLEDLYEKYLSNPQDVPVEWRNYFSHLLQTLPRTEADVSHTAIKEEFLERAKKSARTLIPQGMQTAQDQQQERILELINAYRRFGHLQAQIDPLNLYKGVSSPALDLSFYGFSEKDLQKTFNVESFPSVNKSSATLNEIYQTLRRVYSGHIGFEYMHIERLDEVKWLQEKIEQGWANFNPSNEEKLRILHKLIVADGLEKYLGFKYVGQKRFSLEGGDALIPLLDSVVNRSAKYGVKEVIIGMAHRGRLNVLVNTMGKEPSEIFAAFEGKGISKTHSGDVKYHLGYSSNINTFNGAVHVALAFNPSHLEIVSPVAQGSVRARQRRRHDVEQRQVLPIQIHGDAAFSSQGVVMETFSMSQARWFTVGGSFHIVINNQIGFTISDPKDSRSGLYCTDPAKMVAPPIFHVNGNDAEAVYFAALLALDYRQTFKRDVVIDLVCYRRHGHNEADEPAATQPIMYKIIKAMPVPYQIYANKLLSEGMIDQAAIKKQVAEYRDLLDLGKSVVELSKDTTYEYLVNWEPFIGKSWTEKAKTAVPAERLKKLAEKLEKLPDGFVVQAQVKKGLDVEKKMTAGEVPINWGYAENLAYATLLEEGYPIRLCGQDSGRGTFAHRHGVLHDQNTDAIYIPLCHISQNQAQINLVDSLLSEEAVLAFEYGYATAEPNFLVIWEAQYGDFANGAQVVIDQFISSGEQKWGRLCGLVMYLPHGYEGSGPEHSSARLERYLQLCAQENIQVCIPTTPAQIFHLIRRQMLRCCRKPLIVMTPKSMLRNPLASSSLDELSNGEFKLVIPEIDKIDPKSVDRLILCAGKVYYELLEQRRKDKLQHIAIIRIEQLYPFPEILFQQVLKLYHHVKDIVWCQEEPQNQGAWSTLQGILMNLLTKEQTLSYVGRQSSASPAVGYHSVHEEEQKKLITQALKRKT